MIHRSAGGRCAHFLDGGSPPVEFAIGLPIGAYINSSGHPSLVAQDSLPLDITERKEVYGVMVTEYNARLVPKTDENYSNAVWSLLQSEYGDIVDVPV